MCACILYPTCRYPVYLYPVYWYPVYLYPICRYPVSHMPVSYMPVPCMPYASILYAGILFQKPSVENASARHKICRAEKHSTRNLHYSVTKHLTHVQLLANCITCQRRKKNSQAGQESKTHLTLKIAGRDRSIATLDRFHMSEMQKGCQSCNRAVK